MNEPVYSSVFKKEFQELVALKRSLGFSYATEASAFRRIDLFFIENRLSDKCITKELCDLWCRKRSHESVTNQASRISTMRVSELRLAKIRNLNLTEGYITVHEAKNHKERIIPIHLLLTDRCLKLKKKIHAASSEDEYFFMIRPRQPMPLVNVYRNFRRYLEKAGIPHAGNGPRVHDFRHTYCVNLLRKWTDEGKDLMARLPYMRTMLGHEGFDETAYYLKLTTERFPYIKEQLKISFPDLIKEAAIKAFASYAQFKSIECIAPLQDVSGIKAKKAAPKEVSFLTVEQMSALINFPDINSYTGFRHRMLLTLLYDSGCRVQELCDITMADVSLGSVSTVHLHGKGNKYRTVVISDETATLIRNYISRYRSNAVGTQPLITNRCHQKIDRGGIAYIVKKYADAVRKEDSSFPEHVHCHMFRHSKAMHMLEARINIIYIRDFLGHEDISTTMVYVRADNRLKNDAINKLAPKVTGESDMPDWSKDRDLMQFLNSLK